MLEGIEELIKRLNDKIEKYQNDIESIQRKVKELQSKSSYDQISISDKEEKLDKASAELIAFQKERDDIREEIGKKIEELNLSNLSKEERSEKISALMTGEYQKLKGSCQKITQMWKDWGTAKDDLYKLKEKLENSRLEAIKSLEKTKHRQWIIIWVLLFAVILLSLSLSLSLSLVVYHIQQKKKKKQ